MREAGKADERKDGADHHGDQQSVRGCVHFFHRATMWQAVTGSKLDLIQFVRDFSLTRQFSYDYFLQLARAGRGQRRSRIISLPSDAPRHLASHCDVKFESIFCRFSRNRFIGLVSVTSALLLLSRTHRVTMHTAKNGSGPRDKKIGGAPWNFLTTAENSHARVR